MTRTRVDRRRHRREPVALITGAGRGIGRATAEAFAARGYRVVVAEIASSLGRRTERALVRKGATALFLHTDVADAGSVGRTVQRVLRRFGHIDCLVNNAGVLKVARLSNLSLRDLDRMLAVNLRGPLLFTRAVLPTMRRQRSGSVINVASQLGKVGAGEYVTYCVSKFAVVGFTEALAEELAGSGVRVWAVCPGLVDTPMARHGEGVSSHEREELIRPETVARVIVSLATGRRRTPSGAAVDVP